MVNKVLFLLLLSFCSESATGRSFSELVSRTAIPRGNLYISIDAVANGGMNGLKILDSHYAQLQSAYRLKRSSETCTAKVAKIQAASRSVNAKRRAIKNDLRDLDFFLKLTTVNTSTGRLGKKS